MTITANYVDLLNKKTYPAEIEIADGKIASITAIKTQVENYILPGFIDAHIHIESSMLTPTAFAAIAVKHGTVASISDPHEIANVCGMQGVQYMIDNAKQSPLKFHFGAPSCVPATSFETAGAILDSNDVAALLALPEIFYLSEVMNYPGVLHSDEEVMKKINAATLAGKPIDGHAPGLTGNDAINYINAGISTDHECYTYEEALHKLQHGMKVLIREGSAAKNFDALHALIPEWHSQLMFCCDDKHPDELLLHHINHHVARAVAHGYNVYDVLSMACINPVAHYNMQVGTLQVGHAADCIVVKDLVNFEVLQTIIDGKVVFANDQIQFESPKPSIINQFNCAAKNVEDFETVYAGQKTIDVIVAIDGQLITHEIQVAPLVLDNKISANVENDILHIAVVNRYNNAPVANAFIKNFGLQRGAIASSVAHDCHNIIAVGTSAAEVCKAVNLIIVQQGGLASVDGDISKILPLPIAGIMSNKKAPEVAANYTAIHTHAKELGCSLTSPFMTLSFMALLVIPQLKLSDKGLFDGATFAFRNKV